MKAVTLEELERFLESVSSEYDVRVPIMLHDGSRTLGRLGEGKLAIRGGKIPFKPTSVFFPQWETMLLVDEEGKIKAANRAGKPIFLLGMTAQDLDCLEFIDKFFSTSFRDDVYFSKRDGAAIVGISGKCGIDGGFMKIAGGKCDLELICEGEEFLVVPYSTKGKELEERIRCAEQDASIDLLKKESDALPDADQDILEKASEMIRSERVPDEFWRDIAARCIVCGSCNFVCPTCTCFEVYDRNRNGLIERQRMWDSCQFDGFMREASGHNPMGTEMSRTRRRIHHKLVADRIRWGHMTCFRCGRCDDVCPTGIGMLAVCKEIVARYG